jgi:hypothetical protein
MQNTGAGRSNSTARPVSMRGRDREKIPKIANVYWQPPLILPG